jgi:hypothetical protein
MSVSRLIFPARPSSYEILRISEVKVNCKGTFAKNLCLCKKLLSIKIDAKVS